MASNPVNLPMIQPAGGIITCVSNAAYWQKVVLTWGTTSITFQGSGEGVPMKLSDGSTSYPVAPSRQNYSISAWFQNSPSGPNGPFTNSNVQNPIIIPGEQSTQILVTAEDATDNDDNDSLLMINYQSLG